LSLSLNSAPETFPVVKTICFTSTYGNSKELHAKGMVMKQNAQITTSMERFHTHLKAQYGVDMSGKATLVLTRYGSAVEKQQITQLLRNMQHQTILRRITKENLTML
jgi:hypothetical protein